MARNELLHQTCWNAATPSFGWLNEERDRRAVLLDAIASALAAERDSILATTSSETALTMEELAPEFARMVGTLRVFADVVREGTWVRAAVDQKPSEAKGLIGPNHDIRRMLVPLGAAAVFGASNFPLAYGVCGGDTASSLAAGCPVVVKEHPAHPKTGRLIFEIARKALIAQGVPKDVPGFVLGYVENEDPNDLGVAKEVVQHPAIQAVGFTGSQPGGRALERLALERGQPIPVFAEMGSVNPVYVMAGAASRRGRAIADELADSLLARHGQQCTRPGLVFVQEGERVGAALRERLVERFSAAAARDMLAPWVRDSYVARVDACTAVHGVRVLAQGAKSQGPRVSTPILLGTDAKTWSVNDTTLHGEIFGPAAFLIDCPKEPFGPYAGMEPHLVSSWYFESEDQPRNAKQSHVGWTPFYGRVVYNGVPTGVRVAPAMVHGGPFPATNRPDTTAVGPLAIERWCRPVCFQNCPQELLPPELQDGNPLKIVRHVNGVLGRA